MPTHEQTAFARQGVVTGIDTDEDGGKAKLTMKLIRTRFSCRGKKRELGVGEKTTLHDRRRESQTNC